MELRIVDVESRLWFDTVMEGYIINPLKTYILIDTPTTRFITRLNSSKLFIDELYHENSKWNRYITPFEQIHAFYKGAKEALSTEVVERNVVDPGKGLFIRLDRLPDSIQKIMRLLISEPPLLEVYVVMKSPDLGDEYGVFRLDKGVTTPWFTFKKIIPKEALFHVLNNCVFSHEEGYKEAINNLDFIIFIVGNNQLARIIYGYRGYRILLIRAGYVGRMIQSLVESNQAKRVIITPLFMDNNVNELIGIDGTEFAVLNIAIISNLKISEKGGT